jgi:hypothetical protein
MIYLSLFCLFLLPLHVRSVNHEPLIRAGEAVGMTVSDMDRSVGFSKLLFSKKVSDVEVTGREYEQLQVRDTGESLSFYRVMLGFNLLVKVNSTTLSRSLNNVF